MTNRSPQENYIQKRTQGLNILLKQQRQMYVNKADPGQYNVI